jgi:hypothetical protein
MTARKSLDVYDWALGSYNNEAKFKLLRNK